MEVYEDLRAAREEIRAYLCSSDTKRRQFQSLADNHPHHLAWTRAERRANANFLGSLGYLIGHDSIDADHS